MALTPVNRQEEWYQQMINASTGNYLPTVETTDKDKYLHTNDTTGDLEWVAASPSSSGGMLVVTDTNGTLDKTWQEIYDAGFSVWKHQESVGYYTFAPLNMIFTGDDGSGRTVYVVRYGEGEFGTTSASDYPSES